VLKAAGRFLDVRDVHWPFHTPRAQSAAYEHAIMANRREFDWIAFVDSDEFIVTHGRHTVRSLCGAAGDAAGIGINWAMFGTNGHVGMPDGLLIETFTRRSADGFAANRHVKSIVRPMAVESSLNPHAFRLDGPIIGAAGQPLAWQEDDGERRAGVIAGQADFSVAQINHYFTRSHAHWARKVARGYPNPASMAKLQHFEHYDRNEIEDRSAMRNLVAVQACRSGILRQCQPMPVLPPRPVPHLAGLSL
jgi:hypothetical protein